MANPIISVVVCTYNREKFIHNCLESLKNQSIEQDIFEVLVIDNNSKDQSASIIHDFLAANPTLPFKYFFEAQQGLSFARNRGIQESLGKWITYIDDDAEADIHFLKNLLAAMETHVDAVGFGGKIIPNYIDGRPNWMTSYVEGAFASKLDRGEISGLFGHEIKGFPIGCNMTYSKEVLKTIGGFNPNLGRHGTLSLAGEEKHIYQLITARRMKVVYLPNVIVSHLVESSRLRLENLKKLSSGIGISENIRTAGVSKMAYFKKFFEVIAKWLASILILIFFTAIGKKDRGKYVYLFRYHILISFLK